MDYSQLIKAFVQQRVDVGGKELALKNGEQRFPRCGIEVGRDPLQLLPDPSLDMVQEVRNLQLIYCARRRRRLVLDQGKGETDEGRRNLLDEPGSLLVKEPLRLDQEGLFEVRVHLKIHEHPHQAMNNRGRG